MAKGRKTAALAALGLGAAALSGMFDKKKDKADTATEDKSMTKDEFLKMEADAFAKERRIKDDTTADASVGMSKDRLADMKTPVRKAPVRKAPTRAATPATSAFSVPTAANRAESARFGGRDNSMMDELQGLGRLRENRGDMTETGSERIARKQEAAAQKMRGAYGFKKGGSVSSASKRADGCAVKGKTRGKMV